MGRGKGSLVGGWVGEREGGGWGRGREVDRWVGWREVGG